MYQAFSKSTYCTNSKLIIKEYKTLHKSLQKYYYFYVDQNFKVYQFNDKHNKEKLDKTWAFCYKKLLKNMNNDFQAFVSFLTFDTHDYYWKFFFA